MFTVYDMLYADITYGSAGWSVADVRQMDSVAMRETAHSTALVPYAQRIDLPQTDQTIDLWQTKVPITGAYKVDVQDLNRPVFSFSWDAESFRLTAGIYYQIEFLVQFMRDDGSVKFGDVKGWTLKLEANELIKAATAQVLSLPAVSNYAATSMVLALSGQARKAASGRYVYLRVHTQWDNKGSSVPGIEVALVLILRSFTSQEYIPIPAQYAAGDYQQLGRPLLPGASGSSEGGSPTSTREA